MGNYLLVAAVSKAMIIEGAKNMVVGLGVVFSVLIILCLIIWAFKFLGALDKSEAAEQAPSASKGAPAPRALAPAGPGSMDEVDVDFNEVDAETAAVILAAVAQETGGNFEVTSIKKSN